MNKYKISNHCDCILKMSITGQVDEYKDSYDNELSVYSDSVFYGQICIVNEIVRTEINYDDEDGIKEDFRIMRVLFPIEYCPICGKKLEYKIIKELKLNR